MNKRATMHKQTLPFEYSLFMYHLLHFLHQYHRFRINSTTTLKSRAKHIPLDAFTFHILIANHIGLNLPLLFHSVLPVAIPSPFHFTPFLTSISFHPIIFASITPNAL